MRTRVLIVGATSGIARAAAQEFARHGHDLVLAGRDLPELAALAADIGLRHGCQVAAIPFDALEYASHPDFFAACLAVGELAGVLLCHGYMADQAAAQAEFAVAQRMVETNYTSYISLLHLAAAYLEQRRGGWLAALSSVAGDRGRQSNYVYGSTKAALTTFLQGLRNRLAPAGVAVVTIKPGFVDTGMTWGVLKPGPLVASPEVVARGLYKAIARRQAVVYLPGFWRYIMWIIRSIPEPLFKRLRL